MRLGSIIRDLRRMFRRLAVLALAIALLAVTDQAFTRGYVYSHIGSGFSWKGAAQSWSGSTQAVTLSDFTTYVQNNGACSGAASNALIGLNAANACATNGTPHSQILTNGTFAGASYTGWTSAGSCIFGALSSPDEENSDGGTSQGHTSTTSSCSGGDSQSVTLSGVAPTSQTYSFWYNGTQAQAGDPINCTVGYGSATVSLVVNGTTVVNGISATLDGAWHQVTGSMTALTTGSNTIEVDAGLTPAQGTTGSPTCVTVARTQQIIYIDNIVVGATY